MKRILNQLMLAALLMVSIPAMAESQQEKMNQCIDQLMAKMTVEEKLGQMNQLAVGDITTGFHKDTPAGQP